MKLHGNRVDPSHQRERRVLNLLAGPMDSPQNWAMLRMHSTRTNHSAWLQKRLGRIVRASLDSFLTVHHWIVSLTVHQSPSRSLDFETSLVTWCVSTLEHRTSTLIVPLLVLACILNAASSCPWTRHLCLQKWSFTYSAYHTIQADHSTHHLSSCCK